MATALNAIKRYKNLNVHSVWFYGHMAWVGTYCPTYGLIAPLLLHHNPGAISPYSGAISPYLGAISLYVGQ